MSAVKRLQKELKDLNFDVELVDDDIYHWQVALNGPADTPYFGGTFVINIVFPKDYPFAAPKVTFSTVIYHPNIDHKNGGVCLAALKDDWVPTLTAKKILEMLTHLMEEPRPNDPLEPKLANLFVENRAEFNKNAAACTAKHAM